MTTKKDRFNDAYDYLIWRRIVRVQNDVAKAMSSSQANVSMALKGDPRVLTDKFLKRFCAVYPLFNLDYMLTGRGEMLMSDQAQAIAPSPETSMVELCAQVIADNERLHQELREAIEETKKLHADLSQVLAELNSRTTINQTYNLAPADLPRVAET
jgi:hypothetical protein